MKRKKCYIYTRVSTAAQTEGYSLEAQLGRLREYAGYKDLEIAGEYCDAGKSGKSIAGRPSFLQMLDDISSEKDNVSYVLVFKLSRFGRNAADILKSIQLLEDFEVDLICVEDAIDSSTAGGKLTLTILSAVAEIERENINVQFMAGKLQKIMDGGWPGGPAPYGYRSVNKELVIEPDEAEIVKLIYERYMREDGTLNGVAIWLNNNGYCRISKGQERPFTYDFVVNVLDNPIYHGKLMYNRRTNTKGIKSRKKIEADGIHEAIITDALWQQVREKRKGFHFYCVMVMAGAMVLGTSMTAFAASDPLTVVNNLSDFIFGLIRAVGLILLGWGIVQVGLSLQSHDPSQRSNGFLTLAGGIVITFAKEILTLITG